MMTDIQKFEMKALVNWLSEDPMMISLWKTIEFDKSIKLKYRDFKEFAKDKIACLWEDNSIYMKQKYSDVKYLVVEGKMIYFDIAWQLLCDSMSEILDEGTEGAANG